MPNQMAEVLPVVLPAGFLLAVDDGADDAAQLTLVRIGHVPVISHQCLFIRRVRIRILHPEEVVQRDVEKIAQGGNQRGVRACDVALPVADRVAGYTAGLADLLLLKMSFQSVFAQGTAKGNARFLCGLLHRKINDAVFCLLACHTKPPFSTRWCSASR